jgi:PAS domain S-box-containing protein
MSSRFRPEDLHAILEGISDAIVTLDDDLSYIAINRAAAEIFRELGRQPERMIGKSLWQVFPEVRGTIVEQELTRLIELRIPVKYEVFYPPAKKWYRTDGYPSGDGVVLIFREIVPSSPA